MTATLHALVNFIEAFNLDFINLLRQRFKGLGDLSVASEGRASGRPQATESTELQRTTVAVGMLRVARIIVDMTVKEILARLESFGDDARRAHNTKAGAPENQFGVKLGDIRAMAKQIKTDHELALKLWDACNVEAQLLATLIIKPKLLSADQLDELTRSTTCAQVADWLNANVVAQHPEKESLRDKWMKTKDRWAARAGWNLTASRVSKDADGLDLPALLDRIEKELPIAMPEVQWTMNNTLGAIGIHHPKHRKRAVAIGEKIGLYRDWPVSKGCTPPYVPVWVEAMVKRQG